MSVAVVLVAVGMAGLAPMLDSLTIQTLGERRERFGRARAAGSAAFIVGSLGTGALIDRGGATALFTLLVPALLATSFAAWILLRGGERPRVAVISPLEGLVGIIRHRTLALFLLGSTLVWTSVTAVTTFISVHMFALGAAGPLVGSVWALGALVEVPLMLAFPMLVRRFGDERLLVIAAGAFAIRNVAWAFAGDPLLIVALAPLGGVGFGLFYVGTVGYVARTVPADVQATAQGLFSGTSFSTGSILGALIGGQLAGALGIPSMFAIAGVTTAFAGALVWWAIEGERSRASRVAEREARGVRV
jgi:PPP family 3-phenylpropionic acid transporter